MSPAGEPDPALGQAIRRLREKRSMSQESVAHAANMTTGALGKIERGLTNPTWATVRSICTALDVPMGELVRLAERLRREGV
jgi:transcriptional regulator with XRE-family HTH domain